MNLQPTITDGELLKRIANGCEQSFVALYRRESPRVYRFALRMCGSPEIADEVTQEVFLFFMRNNASFDPRKGELSPWLMGVARKCTLKVIDRERRYIVVEDAELESGSSEDTLADLTHGETLESLRAAVLALPPHFREVVVLCELEEMSYEQAASTMDCAIGTVRSRLHRARALLREKLTMKAGCGS